MTPEELIVIPDAERKAAVEAASTALLAVALEIAKNRGAAFAASDIAYEIGRRDGYEAGLDDERL